MKRQLMQKTLILSLFMIGFITSVFSQIQTLPDNWADYIYTFEDTTHWHSLSIDTINFPNNLWQIGQPQKNTIDIAFSQPNVIVTDTANPYLSGSSSVFEIEHKAQDGFLEEQVAVFSGYYYVDSDTLLDYGKIEFSPDNGITWINLLTDTVYSEYYNWFTEKPVLTGYSGSWRFFGVQLAGINQFFEMDSTTVVKYKISFIANEDNQTKDGLAFDDLHFKDYALNVNERNKNDYQIEIFPNPCHELLYVSNKSCNESRLTLTIHDVYGEIIKKKILNKHYSNEIYMKELKKGVYIIVVKNKNQIVYQQKIIKI